MGQDSRFRGRGAQAEASLAQLDAAEREQLKKSQFAYVDSDGEEKLPIHDETHVRNAIARFSQTDFESKAARERARKKIMAAAERYKIEVDDDSNIAARGG